MPPDAHPLPLAAAVAAAFAARWARTARAVTRREDGDEAGIPDDAHAPTAFVYIDGFAGDDLRRGGALTDARALHTLHAVEAALATRGTFAAVLVEEDPAVAVRLADALRADGADVRLGAAPPDVLGPGERWVVRGTLGEHAADLARLADASASLVVLTPSAAGQLPLEAAAPLLAVPTADVLVRLPDAEFQRLAETRGPLADLPPLLRRTLDGCAGFLREPPGAWLPALRAAADAVAEARERFRAAVVRAADRPAVALALRDESGGSASLLLLATRTRHALALNDAVRAAGAALLMPGAERPEPVRPPARDLFGDAVPSAGDAFDAEALSRRLAEAFRGRTVAAGALMALAAEAGAGWDAVRTAVARLRREGALRLPAAWDEDAAAEFPRVPVPPRRRGGARGTPAMPDGDLPLFAAAVLTPAQPPKRRGGRARRTPPPNIRSPAGKNHGRWSTPQLLK